MGKVRVEERLMDNRVEVWLVNETPHPASLVYGEEVYVLGGGSVALLKVIDLPQDTPSQDEPKEKGKKRPN